MDAIKNFMVNNPSANIWLTVILAIVVFIIVIKIIKSVISAVIGCIIISLFFNIQWGNVINGVISSGEITKYLNKENAVKVQELYNELKYRSKKNSASTPELSSPGRKALKYIVEGQK